MGFIQYGIPTFHFDNTGKITKDVNIYKRGYHASESKARIIYVMGGSDIPTLPSRTPSAKMLVLESVRVLKEISKS